MNDWVILFSMGLLGGAHCLGMCGGFAVLAAHRGGGRLVGYLTGKTITYALLGLMAGWLGFSLAVLGGYQRALTVLVGLLLIAAGLGAVGLLPSGLFGGLSVRLADLLGRLTGRYGRSGSVALGLVNGLLPCGLVYAALGYAAGMADPVRSALGMGLFGLGTAPALTLLALAGSRLGQRWQARLAHIGGWLVVLLGLWLLIRPWVMAMAMGGHSGHAAYIAA